MGKFRLSIDHNDTLWTVHIYEGQFCICSFSDCASEQAARNLGRAFVEGIMYERQQ